MLCLEGCILMFEGDEVFISHPTFRFHERAWVRPSRPGDRRYYVSFYYESWRHWANWVVEGRPFTARQTNDYQIHGGSGHHNVTYQRHKAGLR